MPDRSLHQILSAADVEAVLAWDPSEVTVAADAKIPRRLADRLLAHVSGWEQVQNPDGSITFKRGRGDAVVREAINDLYKRVGVREESQREEAAALAHQAVFESTAAGRVPVGRGAAVSSGGVRTLGVAISRDFIQDGRVSFKGKTVKTAEDLTVLAYFCATSGTKLSAMRG
ncbi:MAG: hypothetical protein QME76_06745 [Bacillota bacterium]|nr:hypothetical protein [Bacillota bacterium]